jgi:DNA-binding transcriptional MerR regulator
MSDLSYLSAADAARILGITPAAVRLMHQRGDLPIAAKTESGIHLFSRAVVERVANDRARRRAAGREHA